MRFSPLRAARFNGSWSSGGSVIAGKPDSTPKRERVSFPPGKTRPISKTSRPRADCVADGSERYGPPPKQRAAAAMTYTTQASAIRCQWTSSPPRSRRRCFSVAEAGGQIALLAWRLRRRCAWPLVGPEADVPQRLKADARVDLLKLDRASDMCDVCGD